MKSQEEIGSDLPVDELDTPINVEVMRPDLTELALNVTSIQKQFSTKIILPKDLQRLGLADNYGQMIKKRQEVLLN